MKKIISRYVETSKQEKFIEFMKVFDYELLERFIGKDMTDLRLIRYNNKPYSKRLSKLEKQYYSYETFPLKIIVVLTILALGLITSFLVLRFSLGSNFDYVFWFLCLLLPAIVVIFSGLGIFIYKYFKVFKDPTKAKEAQQNILKEISKIKEVSKDA